MKNPIKSVPYIMLVTSLVAYYSVTRPGGAVRRVIKYLIMSPDVIYYIFIYNGYVCEYPRGILKCLVAVKKSEKIVFFIGLVQKSRARCTHDIILYTCYNTISTTSNVLFRVISFFLYFLFHTWRRYTLQ